MFFFRFYAAAKYNNRNSLIKLKEKKLNLMKLQQQYIYTVKKIHTYTNTQTLTQKMYLKFCNISLEKVFTTYSY